MLDFNVCTCRGNGCIKDMLQCAPCPPPMLSYIYFREYALNRGLELVEVCSIARRCMKPESNMTEECPDTVPTASGVMDMIIVLSITAVIIILCVLISSVITAFRKKKSATYQEPGDFDSRERIGENAKVHKQSGQMQGNGNEGAASSLKTSDIEIEMVETYNLLSYEQEDDENEDTVPSLKTSEFVLALQGQTSAFKIQSDIFEQESEDLVRDVKKQETTEDDVEVHQETEHTPGNEKEEATSSLKTSDLENEMVVTDKGLSPEEDGENKPADDDDAEEWFLCRTDSDPETDDIFVEC